MQIQVVNPKTTSTLESTPHFCRRDVESTRECRTIPLPLRKAHTADDMQEGVHGSVFLDAARPGCCPYFKKEADYSWLYVCAKQPDGAYVVFRKRIAIITKINHSVLFFFNKIKNKIIM